jgi:nicotinate-nucleotide adenylyltransferase
VKIGIFGGTFNPIHYGHLRAAEEVRERVGLTKIIFIPSKSPPLKTQEIIAPEHRYNMTESAISSNNSFEISDVEYKVVGKSYTVNTIEKLRDIYQDKDLYFILGIDTFLEIPHWWNPERLVSLIDFIAVSKPFFRFTDLLASPYLHASKKDLERLDKAEIELYTTKLKTNKELTALRIPLIEISATEIRRLLREGKSIKYLLPEPVESYIISNKLYKS